MKSKVVLIKCQSYEREGVSLAVKQGISLLGGIDKFIQKEERILLKPNFLSGKPPEDCVTTHPEVFRAVAEICFEAGVNLFYGDSPGYQKPLRVAEKSGIAAVARELNIPIVDFERGEVQHFSSGHQNKQFTIANGILNSDGFISLPKLKTHNLTKITGAVKNQFGCIPGFLKAEFHVKLPAVDDFSKMLVDLNLFLKPRFFIMDAVQAMEGNGPGSGKPYQLNLLMFSDDPVAIDSVACKILNVKPERVLTNLYGQKFGLGKMCLEDIEILGDDISNFYAPDFEVQRGPELNSNRALKYRFLKNLISNKPVIDSDKCDRCGFCIDQCPVEPKALYISDGNGDSFPRYNYNLCIRCFCCQEICPRGAISAKLPVIRRIVDLIGR